MFEILETNKVRFQNLERRAADVIRIITNSKFEYKESEMVIDVCQAIQDILKEAEANSELRGEQAAKNFYEMGLDIEKIAQGINYPLDMVKEWLKPASENS